MSPTPSGARGCVAASQKFRGEFYMPRIVLVVFHHFFHLVLFPWKHFLRSVSKKHNVTQNTL